MRTLFGTSIVTVVCALLIWAYVAPQLISTGVIETGPLMEIMVLVPTLVGIPSSAIGAVTGLFTVGSGQNIAAKTAMTGGHIVTVAIAVAVVVWALGFGSTGWELIVLPISLALGQIVVLAGIITVFVQRRQDRLLE
ncbi:putative uncharacterized protein [Rhodococcus sp. AW25M09]|uniref:hypothetical protein n=1 Tax=Rhodococcus sp. AW25M09 TaxID=1268303 RepID=UPI0002AC48F0|nr:hypothetical protein [Rhodococcus sp. AW25M09]CCQ16347.1 putative uncharacterized protein [Rhodococcus sp. AW25M09]